MAALPTCTTLEAFFHDELAAAKERSDSAVPDDVSAYGVSVLARFADQPDVTGRTTEPLALQFLTAQGTAGEEGTTSLRAVADRALYIAGVVPRSLDRGAVRVSYVRAIGQAAYAQAAGRRRGWRLLEKVAQWFDPLAELMGDVVEGSAPREELLTVYERWLQHGHRRDLRRLVAAGLLPARPSRVRQ